MSQHTNIQRHSARLLAVSLIVAACFTVSGCGGGSEPAGPVTITVWSHTGTPEEQRVFDDQVVRFNAGQSRVVVQVTHIPEAEYNDYVEAAAAEGRLSDVLPDVLNVDGPYVASYVAKGYLITFDGIIPLDIRSDLLPSIREQGTYQGKLYAVGTFDSGLGLYGNRRKLEAIRARIPTRPGDAWTVDELERVLDALAFRDRDAVVLDLRIKNPGEWYTYAFSPVVQSAGGDLIDRKTYQTADGFLNTPEVVAALERIQKWIRFGWVDRQADGTSFMRGDVALSWSGHWDYARYKEALGDDLVLMPLPNFGQGTKTGMGSWAWGITTKCPYPRSAMQFLRFLLEEPEEILAISNASSAVPGRGSFVAQSPLYGFDGPLQLFFTQLNCCGVPRPKTPHYPIITRAFQQAFQEFIQGGNVKAALDRTVAAIDQGIKESGGSSQ